VSADATTEIPISLLTFRFTRALTVSRPRSIWALRWFCFRALIELFKRILNMQFVPVFLSVGVSTPPRYFNGSRTSERILHPLDSCLRFVFVPFYLRLH